MANVEWTEHARSDLAEILGYIARHDVTAAERLLDMVEKTVEHAKRFPLMYRPGRVSGTREAVVHPNYILIYEVVSDTVRVLGLLHAKRRYP